MFLHMKGSCSGCPSSTATLKHGIQNLLRHFVPDVVEVAAGCDRRIGPFRSPPSETICGRSVACPCHRHGARGLLRRGPRHRPQGGMTSRSLPMMRGHAEALMPLIAAVMSAADVEFADLDRIAVTVGPGSFTGLRVGVAAARGIALAAGKPAVGLTTLAALAAPFFDADDSKALLAVDRCAARPGLHAVVRARRPHPGRAAPCVHARRHPRRHGEPDPHRRQCRQAHRGGLARQRAPAAAGERGAGARHRLGGAARRRDARCLRSP